MIGSECGARQAWSEIASLRFQHDHENDWAPVTQIDFRQADTGWDYPVSLSGVPNGIFLAQVIARVAAAHGVEVQGA